MSLKSAGTTVKHFKSESTIKISNCFQILDVHLFCNQASKEVSYES
jgi:hypothetical protein